MEDNLMETQQTSALEIEEFELSAEESAFDNLVEEATDAANNAEDAKSVVDTQLSDEMPSDTDKVGMRMETEPRWFALHTFNGYELVAEDNLRKTVENFAGLKDRILEIFIPTEEVVVEKKGKKILVPQRTMPSYIFVKMIYGDDIWHVITRTRGITGFVGPKGRALALSAKEVAALKLERRASIDVSIEIGDLIQVIDGPLVGQTANVTAVDAEGQKCTVEVNLFGRATSVELAFSQIKKQ